MKSIHWNEIILDKYTIFKFGGQWSQLLEDNWQAWRLKTQVLSLHDNYTIELTGIWDSLRTCELPMHKYSKTIEY